MAKLPVWYRHRIVKRLLLPGVPWVYPNGTSAGRLPRHSDIEIAKMTLRQQVDAEMSVYLRAHHPGQILVTEFVMPRLGGVEVFVAQTLYGPSSVKDEIIAELAERGEA